MDAVVVKDSKKHGRRLKRTRPLPYLLLIPAYALLSLWTFYPFIKTIVISLALTNKQNKVTRWVGFANWIRVLSQGKFWDIVGTTLKLAVLNFTITLGIAMIFALMATKKVRWSKLYQTMYALPMTIAASPTAAIFIFMFRQNAGLVNSFLGLQTAWLRDMPYAMVAVCTITSWMHVGTSFILLLESARLDGAGPLRRIWNIILPLASPQIFFVVFLNITSAFKTFAQIQLLTGGGPANKTKNLIYFIYENAIINGRYETACVQAIFLFLLIFAVTRIQFLLEKKVVHYQ